MKPRFFGTDGVRGKFGEAPLDEPTVRRLGAALALELARKSERPRAVLGGDTRDSTSVICSWLAGELSAKGVDITYLGTISTPGVTFNVTALQADVGIAVSASHNPYPDNGVKLIDSTGFKWSPKAEAALEQRMESVEVADTSPSPEVDESAVQAYRHHLLSCLDGRRLDGLKVVLDVGFGAASPFAEGIFSKLGAETTVLHDAPDGRNINLRSGSTHPEALAERVKADSAHLGIAFDGDADRAILVDELGQVRDGDAILYLWALDLAGSDRLPQRGVVATTMSNLGLEIALKRHDIELVRCGVGDREVVAAMQDRGLVLGGEQSGHVVCLDRSTTGDGLLTALQLADVCTRAGRPLSELLKGFERFPQLLRNLPVSRKPPLDSLPSVVEAARSVEKELGDAGRLVLRYSGTENLVRIMIEGSDRAQIEALADRLAAVLEEALG